MNGHTLVPIQIISKVLGSDVNYNEKDKYILVKDGSVESVSHINSTTATVNHVEKTMDAPAVFIDGKAYILLKV